MKFITTRPFADPDAAARKLVEIANAMRCERDSKKVPSVRGAADGKK